MGTKPLKVALALIIAVFAIYVYNFPPSSIGTANEPTGETPATETPTDQPVTETPSKDGFECPDYQNEDMSTLDADLVHQMTEDYRTYQWNAINSSSRFPTNNDEDAYSIWFDLVTLKKFLYHIEKISKSQDATITNDKLGVRIYYAAYPDRLEMRKYPDLRPTSRYPELANYGALHTLVMIPTITTENGAMLDFNPLDSLTYDSGLAKIDKYTKNHPANIPNNTAALSGTTAASRNTGARNHGMLYPPAGSLIAPSALGF